MKPLAIPFLWRTWDTIASLPEHDSLLKKRGPLLCTSVSSPQLVCGLQGGGCESTIPICVGGLTVHRGADGVIFFSVQLDVKEGALTV